MKKKIPHLSEKDRWTSLDGVTYQEICKIGPFSKLHSQKPKGMLLGKDLELGLPGQNVLTNLPKAAL